MGIDSKEIGNSRAIMKTLPYDLIFDTSITPQHCQCDTFVKVYGHVTRVRFKHRNTNYNLEPCYSIKRYRSQGISVSFG
jgi:hypothetical protein